MLESEDVSCAVQDFRKTLACALPVSGDAFRIVFLGTGAALPSKYRNGTNIIVEI